MNDLRGLEISWERGRAQGWQWTESSGEHVLARCADMHRMD